MTTPTQSTSTFSTNQSTSTFSTNQSMASASRTTSYPTRRKRSMVWTYFTKSGQKDATCDLCGSKVPTGGNTTNMMKVNL